MSKLQAIHDACRALEDECEMAYLAACGGYGSDFVAAEAIYDKAHKARRPQFAALEDQCEQLSGHVRYGASCRICGHRKEDERQVTARNLLRG